MALSVGILLAILGMVLLSISKFTGRLVMAHARPLTAAVYIHALIAATVGVLALRFGSFAFPPEFGYYSLTVLIGAVAIVPLYVAYQHRGLGLPTAVSSAFVPITVLLSVVFYGERFSSRVWLGMVLVFLGVLLVSIDLRKWRTPSLEQGLGWALITMLGWGAYFFMIKRIIVQMGPWPATFALEIGVVLCIAVFAAVRGALGGIPRKATGWVTVTGIADGLGVLAYYSSFQFLAASIAATILQVSIVLCTIFAILFLRERFDRLKLLAILVTFVGMVLVTL